MTETEGFHSAEESHASGAGSETTDQSTETGIPAEELGGAAPEGTNAGERKRGEPGDQGPAGSVLDNSTAVDG